MLLSILHVGLFPNSHAFWITGMLVADRSIPLKATPLSYSLLCRLVRKKMRLPDAKNPFEFCHRRRYDNSSPLQSSRLRRQRAAMVTTNCSPPPSADVVHSILLLTWSSWSRGQPVAVRKSTRWWIDSAARGAILVGILYARRSVSAILPVTLCLSVCACH